MHWATSGTQMGSRSPSLTSTMPWIGLLFFSCGILTAILMSARSPLFILKRIYQQYSKLLLLRTENTYSSRLSNSQFLQRAIMRKMEGSSSFWGSLLVWVGSDWRGLRLTEKSTSSIAPGTRPGWQKITSLRLKMTSSALSSSFSSRYSPSFSSSPSPSLVSPYSSGMPSSSVATQLALPFSIEGSNLMSSSNLSIYSRLRASMGLLLPSLGSSWAGLAAENQGITNGCSLIFISFQRVIKYKLSLLGLFYFIVHLFTQV